MTGRFFSGALLLAALPLLSASADPKIHAIMGFTLDEDSAGIAKLIGPPSRVDDSTPTYQSWQYEPPADEDVDDNSPPAWLVCVHTTSRRVLSVTRNFGKPQDVDALFPAAETEVHHWPSERDRQFSVRLRRLPGDKLLLAMGTDRAGQRTTQLILIRRDALRTFMSWLADQLQ
jgi:hypothetical protein